MSVATQQSPATITRQDGDHDLRRRVINFLAGKQMPSLELIEVDADNGTVVLRGRVRSFYEKQLCLHCCQRVAGVVRLVDEVDVATAKA